MYILQRDTLNHMPEMDITRFGKYGMVNTVVRIRSQRNSSQDRAQEKNQAFAEESHKSSAWGGGETTHCPFWRDPEKSQAVWEFELTLLSVTSNWTSPGCSAAPPHGRGALLNSSAATDKAHSQAYLSQPGVQSPLFTGLQVQNYTSRFNIT